MRPDFIWDTIPIVPPCRHAQVLRGFARTEGSLHTLPTKHGKWLVVLDHIVQSFELGRTYPESAVNETLEAFHPDFAALRRHLVDEGIHDPRRRDLLAYGRVGRSLAFGLPGESQH